MRMAVKRIVTNIASNQLQAASAFYGEDLRMTVAKDLGWILTFTADASAVSQISMATEGGSGTQVRDVSVEVGNLDEIYERARAGGYPIEYCPVTEPWGAPLLYTRPVRPLAHMLTHI
jgi:hypothetical protein